MCLRLVPFPFLYSFLQSFFFYLYILQVKLFDATLLTEMKSLYQLFSHRKKKKPNVVSNQEIQLTLTLNSIASTTSVAYALEVNMHMKNLIQAKQSKTRRTPTAEV